MNKEYRDYLKSDKWIEIRQYMIEMYGSTCQMCLKKTDKLQVHHLTYDNIFNEEPEDLILLCSKCHQREHGYSPSRNKKLSRKECEKLIVAKFYNRVRHPDWKQSWLMLAKAISPGFDQKKKAKTFVQNYVNNNNFWDIK